MAAVKAADPDFQRPDGDYGSWYIRDAAGDAYLSGFESWDRVEGVLIADLLAGPLHWLGVVDWDRRLFDSLIPLPDGTSYSAYLVKGSEKVALLDTVDPAMAHVLLGYLDEARAKVRPWIDNPLWICRFSLSSS